MKMIAFTFWAGPQFSLLNLISLLSYARLNPLHELIIYTIREMIDINPSWNSGEHASSIETRYDLSLLSGEPNIQLQYLDLAAEYPKFDSVVHMADYVRIKKLREHGGLWIDSDILFIQPIKEQMRQFTHPVVITAYENQVATGFIYASSGSQFIELLYESANSLILNKSHYGRYQGLGPDLWKDVLLKERKHYRECHFMSEQCIYPYMATQLQQFYSGSNLQFLNHEVLGVHWYNGHPLTKAFINFHLESVIHQPANASPFLWIINQLREKIQLDKFLQEI